jgi:hypothetical protein
MSWATICCSNIPPDVVDGLGESPSPVHVMSEIIDISKELNPQAFQDFKKGQVLGFEKDGITKHYKIVRLDRNRKTCKVLETKLYTEDEINDMPRKEAEDIIVNGANNG